MKRETALRYAAEVARRVHSVNGILATPLCSWEGIRFKRIWVFGSVAKGGEEPNDLDLLIEAVECGRHRTHKQGAKIDRQYLRRYGFEAPIEARREALKWLTRGMRKVSRHMADVESVPIDVKVLLYPRNDLLRESAAGAMMARPAINGASVPQVRREGPTPGARGVP